MDENAIGTTVVEAATNLHRELGPGLLESVYETMMELELRELGLSVERQTSVPITYRSHSVENAFYADLIVENKVILELKSVERLTGVHRKQIQTYLRLTGCRLGYLLNFGAELMKHGIVRCVNGLPE